MLKYFNAALTKLGRAQPFDHLAGMAQLALDSGPVTLVDLTPAPTVIGCSDDAMTIREQVVRMACDLDPVDAADLEDLGLPLAGASLPFEAPWNAVIMLPMVGGGRRLAFLVFVPQRGLDPRRVARFVNAAKRQVAENALTQRYRSDLKRYILMFDHLERTANIGVWECDLISGSMFWSDEMFRIHDRSPGEAMPSVSQALHYFVPPYDKQLEKLLLSAAVSSDPLDVTMPIETAAGRRRTVRVIAQRQTPDDSGTERLAGVLQDVTAAHEANERLWWTANHDALTRLPNRALFADRFHTALERRKRTSNYVCLVLVDVDDFKQVNDTLGHAAGDRLLCLVAERLKKTVRTNDTVARTGGDEFSILLEDVESMEALEAVLDRLRANLDIYLTWDEQTVLVNLSAGAALAPEHALNEHDLTCAADLALYRMKEESCSALALYDPSFGQAQQERAEMMVAARKAIKVGAIVPFYQPQIDIASGRIVGVEALARWIDDTGAVRTASDFSCALADHELGVQIGLAVADRAIVEMAQINRGRTEKLALAVNASAGELLRESFLKRIGSQIATMGAEGAPITVEITEGVVLDDPSGKLTEEIHAANAQGINFSLDDFGTGYASLIHISTLPISELKVDRRFVDGIETDGGKQKVLRGIIDVARTLSLRLIVEGVETAEQVSMITKMGGRFLQGFYYSKAVPYDELVALLAKENPDDDRAPARSGNETAGGARYAATG
ncbi:bifunctional diguanylate cyclase/phosphodiesterase [Acuticoccus sp. I52.16.1]|uniref:putative bifunctional diguanylate cyclase/phosphodiesterase n=1 Tax=Acuticoccus sp. I52.16.1 TaxID=2928472 RepID=UPI001FD36260|nr:bifunctional diguanylate cyclase/phosphodiesterase [Acuticoccus sp. I52.16.1]UOM34477.1 bifunctional diguanylate cyclase/phosphodiesterase [Acuticoccus sp. I52.16.1]